MLPVVVALHVHQVSAATIAVVGAIALALAVVGFSAARKNRTLLFVGSAFLVFALKGFFSSWAILSGRVEHEDLELQLAIADLVVVVLLVIPLFARGRNVA